METLKILVTGVNGQLGYDVMRELISQGHEVIGSGRSRKYKHLKIDSNFYRYIQMDITNQNKVEYILKKIRPAAIIHCAAWTAVDEAEELTNHEIVYKTNVIGTEYLAKVCNDIGAKILFISTDYVFDGNGTEPWNPENSEPNPQNKYGESKFLGEQAVANATKRFFVVRVSWVFGINGKNFVKTMLNVGKSNNIVKVVDDQIGRPTYTPDLAHLLAEMILSDRYGYYHASNEGEYISWYEFTKEIYRYSKLDTKIIPISTSDYGSTKAKRPKNSRLNNSKISENGFTFLPNWKDAIERYIKELTLQEGE